MRMRVAWSISCVTRVSIQITTAIDTTKTISWLKRDAAQRQRHHERAEGDAAAEDAPVGRSALAGLEPHEQGAGDRDHRHDEAAAGTPSRRRHTAPASPERPATAKMPKESASRPSTCTMPRSWSISALGRGLPSGLVRAHHLGAHGVGDHVLDDDAGHAQQRGDHVELVGVQAVIQPPAAPASSTKLIAIRRGAEEHVGAPLRAQQRHGVDELAEHHLHGPRQGEPDRQGRRARPASSVSAFLIQKASATAVRPIAP